MVDTRTGTGGLLAPTSLQMVGYAESTESWITDQPTHSRFYCYACRKKLRVGYDEWHLITYAPMVQAEDKSYRLLTNVANFTVARRM